MTKHWLNGELTEEEHARISLFDHGLLYGDGVFEGIRFYNRKAFRLTEHLSRLFDSASAIGLQLCYSSDQLIAAVEKVILAYDKPNGYLRLVATRGEGPLGIDPRKCLQGTTFILVGELSFVSDKILQNGARLVITSTRRLSSDGLDPRIKSLNYLNHILARIEANNANADEGILLNQQGKVAEGTTDNIFIVKNERLLTPPVSDGALAGITRELILQLAGDLNIDWQERSLAPYDLYTADESFLTGTGAELIPVKEIDGRHLPHCPGPIFKHLQVRFKETIELETLTLQNKGINS